MRLSMLRLPLGLTLLVMVASARDHCSVKITCGECLQTKSCSWCYDKQVDSTTSRCFRSDSQSTLCKDVISNVSKVLYTNNAPASQLSPQKMALQLRVNEPLIVKVTFRQAVDYPVDLYYLTDLSATMHQHLSVMTKMGEELAEKMGTITKDFFLGFGSFVEKEAMPFASTFPKHREEPINDINGLRVPAYCFKNHMKLTSSKDGAGKFNEVIKNVKSSWNEDDPESGLDALVQAVVCKKEIGWRDDSRKLLVFATDGIFHIAGDGRLAGIMTPNDGMCHLKDNQYTPSTELDYPSISQVIWTLRNNSINVIFAVSRSVLAEYTELSQLIDGSKTEELNSDAKNVVQIIRDRYNEIRKAVQLTAEKKPSNIQLTFRSNCKQEGPPRVTDKCSVQPGAEVDFEIEIELTSCPKHPNKRDSITIKPQGINDELQIDFEMICSCPCEQQGNKGFEKNAVECHNNGDLQCGVCLCGSSYFGISCECNATNENTDTSGCRPDNKTMVDCSGFGECICNKCERCKQGYNGRYCECHDNSCPKSGGKVCSGLDHGRCSCGDCVCHQDWEGEACECSRSNESCIPPGAGGGQVCSGHGQCVCGQCVCVRDQENQYSGVHCEKCPTCPGRCDDFKDCVLKCSVNQTGTDIDKESCSNCKTSLNIKEIIHKGRKELTSGQCRINDHDTDCYLIFDYNSHKDEVVLEALKDWQCPTSLYEAGATIALAVFAAIVLIGLALLILWKIITMIVDKREFQKFEKERANCKWGKLENPLYKQATTQFMNPAFEDDKTK